jgi:hypothetical protein
VNNLGNIEKKGLEHWDANKISYRCQWPEFPTRPSFHLTAVCQRQTSRVIMHPTPAHYPQTTMMIERSFSHLSYIIPSPPIGYWIWSYIWPWRWHSHMALFDRSSVLFYFRSSPF